MKLTKKQQQEINFLAKWFLKGKNPTEQDIKDYIQATVYGERYISDKLSKNILRNAKQRLDIQIKLWREDLTIGLISKDELLEDFKDEYGIKLVHSIIKSVDRNYRHKTLIKSKIMTPLAITSFNSIKT